MSSVDSNWTGDEDKHHGCEIVLIRFVVVIALLVWVMS